MSWAVYDETACSLGEGPLWHPERRQLFWFDINGMRLHTRGQHWQFDIPHSAAGWVDHGTLLIASARGLHRFDIASGTSEDIAPLEADNPVTRSNDGRADPWGGFWIGTMGHAAKPGAGAIYRYVRGDLHQLYTGITISNAICFAPDGGHAYFTDTKVGVIMRQALDAQGWPKGDPEAFVDCRAQGLNPDGAVVARDGTLWVAQWGAYRVAAYDTQGQFCGARHVPAAQASCPAFGGPDLGTLFVTSAQLGIPEDVLQAEPANGQTFSIAGLSKGLAEHRVIL